MEAGRVSIHDHDHQQKVVQHHNPGPQRDGISYFLPVILGSVSSMIMLFGLVGVCGLLAFPGQDIDGDVLTMLGDKGMLGTLARALLAFAVFLASPLLVHPARGCVTSLVVHFFGDSRPVLRNTVLTVGIVFVAAAIALSGLDFLIVVSAMGAFLCSPLFFLLPAAALLWIIWGWDGTIQTDISAEAAMNSDLLGNDQQHLYNKNDSNLSNLSAQGRIIATGLAVWLILVGISVFFLSSYLFIKGH